MAEIPEHRRQSSNRRGGRHMIGEDDPAPAPAPEDEPDQENDE